MRFKILFLFFIILSFPACSSNGGIVGGGSWQSSGLSHQHVRVLAVDTNNAQNVYVGDEQGPIFASSDGGQHWMQRSTGLPLSNAIHALSFDATSKKLYV